MISEWSYQALKRKKQKPCKNFQHASIGKNNVKKDKIKDFVITDQSPYYLSSSNSPRAIFIVIKFDSKSYDL